MSVILLMDCHVKTAVTAGLRLRGVNVLTVQEVGLGAATDDEILSYAAERNLVIYTNDEDFLVITAARLTDGVPFSAIVYAHERTLPVGRTIEELQLIASVLDPADLQSVVLRIP